MVLYYEALQLSRHAPTRRAGPTHSSLGSSTRVRSNGGRAYPGAARISCRDASYYDQSHRARDQLTYSPSTRKHRAAIGRYCRGASRKCRRKHRGVRRHAAILIELPFSNMPENQFTNLMCSRAEILPRRRCLVGLAEFSEFRQIRHHTRPYLIVVAELGGEPVLSADGTVACLRLITRDACTRDRNRQLPRGHQPGAQAFRLDENRHLGPRLRAALVPNGLPIHTSGFPAVSESMLVLDSRRAPSGVLMVALAAIPRIAVGDTLVGKQFLSILGSVL